MCEEQNNKRIIYTPLKREEVFKKKNNVISPQLQLLPVCGAAALHRPSPRSLFPCTLR